MRCFLISWLLIGMLAHDTSADRRISDAAKVELERGEQCYREQDYAGAIAAFDAGYAIDPQPIFLYDKAQAQRLAGDCASAIVTYKAFIATNPPAPEAARAHMNIANCEAILAKTASKPEPVVEAEPEPQADESELEPIADDPGELALRRAERAWWTDRVGVTLATGGVIALGVGTGFAVSAVQAADDTALATNVTDWSASRQRWQRDRVIAGVAAGAGVALITLAAIRFSVHDRTVHVAATNGNGALVAVGGAW